MDENSNSRSSSDSVELQGNMDNNSPPYMNGHMDTEQYSDEGKSLELQGNMDNSCPPYMNGHMDTEQYSDEDCITPRLEIVEQPQQRGFRFRYECEGPSHGGLQGLNSERFRKTVPTIKIRNNKGPSQVIVSLVTDEIVPRAHAHKLVGKNCTGGMCILDVKAGTPQISFPNLCVQHVTRKKAAEVLEERIRESIILDKKKQIQDFNANFEIADEDKQRISQQAQKQAKNMQLNVVRLCFQAYLLDLQGNRTSLLESVVSDPIYDSKAPGANALKICRMDKYSGCCTGNEEVFLLCEKVQKDDIQVRFLEADTDGNPLWEAFGNFGPFDVHRQFAIVFKTPEYRNTNIDKPVNVLVMLTRKSDGESSDPKSFTYYPKRLDKEDIDRKRKKLLPPYNSDRRNYKDMDPSNGYQFGNKGGNGNGGGMNSSNNGLDNGGGIPNLDQLNNQMNPNMEQLASVMNMQQLYNGGGTSGRTFIKGRRQQSSQGSRPMMHQQQMVSPMTQHINTPITQHSQLQQMNNMISQSAVEIIAQPSQFDFEEVSALSPLGASNQINPGASPTYMSVDTVANQTFGSQQGVNTTISAINVSSPYNNIGSPLSVNGSTFNTGSVSPQLIQQASPHMSVGSPHSVIDQSQSNITSQSMNFVGNQPVNGGSVSVTMNQTPMSVSQSQAFSSQPVTQPVQDPILHPENNSLETDFLHYTNQPQPGYQSYQVQGANGQYTAGGTRSLTNFTALEVQQLLGPSQHVEPNVNVFSETYSRQTCGYQAREASGGMFMQQPASDLLSELGMDFVDSKLDSKLVARGRQGMDEVDSTLVAHFDISQMEPSLSIVDHEQKNVQVSIREATAEDTTKETLVAREPTVVKETVKSTETVNSIETVNSTETVNSSETGVQAGAVEQNTCEVQTDMDASLRIGLKTAQALQYYAASGDIRALLMVQRFLMLVQDGNGDLPLHTSLINQKYEVFQNLLDVMATLPDSYSRINAYNFHHQTPMHLAVLTDQPLAVDLLVRAGGDTTIVDRNGYTPAHLAVLYGRDECLKNLLKYLRPGVPQNTPFPELNIRCYDGFTPAHLAAQQENLSALKLLVYGKADVNLPDGKSGGTALHHVVEADELSLAAYLILQAGANVNVKRFDGNTPLHIACGRGNVGMVALLMAGGADPSVENDDLDETSSEESDVEESSKATEVTIEPVVAVETEVVKERETADVTEVQQEADQTNVQINEEAVTSDEESDSSVERVRKERIPKSRKGLTPADFADDNEKILRILNGEPYPVLSDGESEEDRGVTQVTDRMQSFNIQTVSHTDSGLFSMKSDMDRLDYPTRRGLSELLDPCKEGCDWSALADKLGLKHFMEGQIGEQSPTRMLLTYFEETGGTISRLCHALSDIHREDAVDLLKPLGTGVDTGVSSQGPGDRSDTPDKDKHAHKDPTLDSGLDSFNKSPSPIRHHIQT